MKAEEEFNRLRAMTPEEAAKECAGPSVETRSSDWWSKTMTVAWYDASKDNNNTLLLDVESELRKYSFVLKAGMTILVALSLITLAMVAL